MNLIIIHENGDSTTSNGNNLLRSALSGGPTAAVIFDGLINRGLRWGHHSKVICAIPEAWGTERHTAAPEVITYKESVTVCSDFVRNTKAKSWITLSNGRFATQINRELLDSMLAGTEADVLAVNAKPELMAGHEKVRLTAKNKVAGFRRFYSDSAEPTPIPGDWPHYVFIKTDVLERVLANQTLPRSFSAFLKTCRSNALTLRAINIAGAALDLETQDGLLNFCRTRLSEIQNWKLETGNSNTISHDSRFVGKVLLGKNIRIGPKVVIMGPTIIGDNVTVQEGAVINSSIISSKVSVPRNQLVQNRVIRAQESDQKCLQTSKSNNSSQPFNTVCAPDCAQTGNGAFRTSPKFSYAGSLKRVVDCLVAIVALILFAPIMPLIALVIKLDSPGPVFFKDKRQGLHGRIFKCLKFRTMLTGADKIQEKLRIASQVDGPQFKMENDPRLSGVGRFLRETYIDEVPQFFNVLLGQMSVVGPRPSPESENTLCPSWRDARLSVRPGITGLWQVHRTRKPMRDFQEWIYYDIEYVRSLSLRMDLWICWQTVKKMVDNFVNHF